jgi:hypothetical protein
VPCRDLGSQAQQPERIERAMPEGDDVRPHARHLWSFFEDVETGSLEENASNKEIEPRF